MTWRIGIRKTHVKTVRNCLNSQVGSGGVSLHLSDTLEIWLKCYICTVKNLAVLRGHSKRRPKLVFKTDYRNTFDLPFVFKTFILFFLFLSGRLKIGFTI